MPVDKPQAEMLATLTCAARPHGARRWDAPGVMAAIAKVRHLDLAEVMMAAGRAARDRDLDTPAAIGNPAAPCWIERPVERFTPEKITASDRCGTCSHPRHEGRCPRCPLIDEHEFTPDYVGDKHTPDAAAAIKAALREEIQPMRQPADRKAADHITPGAGRTRIDQEDAMTNAEHEEQP